MRNRPMGETYGTCGHRIEGEVKGVWWPDTTIDFGQDKVVSCWSYGVLCADCRAERDDWQEKSPWEED